MFMCILCYALYYYIYSYVLVTDPDALRTPTDPDATANTKDETAVPEDKIINW